MSEEILERSASDWSTYSPGNHKDIKKIIQDNINSVCANYVAIGYYLNVINDRRLYEEDGYSGIGEYAAAEYGIQKDRCSWLMKIAKRFCIENSPALLPQYRDFSISKLREMVYLDDEQLDQVSIGMTKVEIKEMRKPEKVKVAPEQLEPEQHKSEIEPRIRNMIIREYINSLPEWKRDNIRKVFMGSASLEERVNYLKSCISFGEVKLNLEKDIKKLYLRKASENDLEISDWYNDYAEFAHGVKIFMFTFSEMAGIADGMLYGLNSEVKLPSVEDKDKPEINPYDAKKPEPGIVIYDVGGSGDIEKYGVISKNSSFSPKYFTVKDKSGAIHNISVESEHWHYTRDEAKRDTWYHEKETVKSKEVNDTPVFENTDPGIMDNQPETVNEDPQKPENEDDPEEETLIFDFWDGKPVVKRCSECEYYDMELDNYRVLHPDTEFPCNDCDDRLCNWIPRTASEYKESVSKQAQTVIESTKSVINEEKVVTEQVETVEAEIVQMVPEYDFDRISRYGLLDIGSLVYDYNKSLEAYKECQLDAPVVRKDKILLDALECLKTVLSAPDLMEDMDENERYTLEDVIDECAKLGEYVSTYSRNNDTMPGRRKAKMRLDAITLLRSELQRQPEADENMVRKMARFAMEWFDKEDYDSADFYLFQARKQLVDNYKYERDFYPDYYNDNRLKQPELPILKNNDQRKAFIDNYESWPVWIDIPHTGEKYYRYDLSREVAMVVKVNKKHAWKGYKETKDYEYGAEQYYLLGVKAEWSQKGSKFIEDPERTFHECNTNKSALIEYLKDYQKK
jgi:hypothetical protein